MTWTPIVIVWLAGFTVIASIVGAVAWLYQSIDRAVRFGTPQGATP